MAREEAQLVQTGVGVAGGRAAGQKVRSQTLPAACITLPPSQLSFPPGWLLGRDSLGSWRLSWLPPASWCLN